MVQFRFARRNGNGVTLPWPLVGVLPLLGSSGEKPAPAVDPLAWTLAVLAVEQRRAELVAELGLAARNLRAKVEAGEATPQINAESYARLFDRARAAIGGP